MQNSNSVCLKSVTTYNCRTRWLFGVVFNDVFLSELNFRKDFKLLLAKKLILRDYREQFLILFQLVVKYMFRYIGNMDAKSFLIITVACCIMLTDAILFG